MKMNAGWARDWISRGSVVGIAGFSIFVLIQNGCSGSVMNGPADGGADDGASIGGCFPGETPTKVGTQTLCCSGTPPTLVCNVGGRVGDPCAGQVSAAPQQTVDITLDVCVTDTCNGDHTPTTYDAKVDVTTTPLTCSNGALAATGDVSTQTVERVCSDVAPLLCASTTYSYDYGYVTSYGYGYYGGQELMTRAVSVSSSTCTTANGAPTPCDVGNF
jgi:hypothetical protein